MHTHFDTVENKDSGTEPSLASFPSPLNRPSMTDARFHDRSWIFSTFSNILSDERTRWNDPRTNTAQGCSKGNPTSLTGWTPPTIQRFPVRFKGKQRARIKHNKLQATKSITNICNARPSFQKLCQNNFPWPKTYTSLRSKGSFLAITHTPVPCNALQHSCASWPPRLALCTNVYRNCMCSKSCRCQKSDHRQRPINPDSKSPVLVYSGFMPDSPLPGNTALSWGHQVFPFTTGIVPRSTIQHLRDFFFFFFCSGSP